MRSIYSRGWARASGPGTQRARRRPLGRERAIQNANIVHLWRVWYSTGAGAARGLRLSLALLGNHVKIGHFYSARTRSIGGSHASNFR